MTEARTQLTRGLIYALLAGAMAGTTFYLSAALDKEHRQNVEQHAATRKDSQALREEFRELNVQLRTNQQSINRVLDAMGHKVQAPE